MRKVLVMIMAVMCIAACVCTGCSADNDGGMIMEQSPYSYTAQKLSATEADSGDSFAEIKDNPFCSPEQTPNSQFSLDINTAGYSVLRRYINDGYSIHRNMVKIEEMVNYFSYDLIDAPQSGMALGAMIMDTPWNNGQTKLAQFVLRAEEVQMEDKQNNLVFLIDTSGSMYGADRLGLVQSAFAMLVDKLSDNDRVSIVTYASGVSTPLSGVSGADKIRIMAAIEDLSASGSTAGQRGIQTAYDVAQEYFISGGNNRVILATDGDFNVGISDQNRLENFIAEKRDTGVYLSILGVGYGNLQDAKIEGLVTNGNGTYAYLDSVTEARRVLVEQIGGSLITVAKDTKAQVTFNPDTVRSYKLLGYENALLTEDEWNDNETDAGEIGSGHTVVAVYEFVLEGELSPEDTLATFTVRYKTPTATAEDESLELSTALSAGALNTPPTEDQQFIAAVVETGLLLRESEYPTGVVSADGAVTYAENGASLSHVQSVLASLHIAGDEFKTEFAGLVAKLGDKQD